MCTRPGRDQSLFTWNRILLKNEACHKTLAKLTLTFTFISFPIKLSTTTVKWVSPSFSLPETLKEWKKAKQRCLKEKLPEAINNKLFMAKHTSNEVLSCNWSGEMKAWSNGAWQLVIVIAHFRLTETITNYLPVGVGGGGDSLLYGLYCRFSHYVTKIQTTNYWSSRYITSMMYKSSWKLISMQIFVPNGFLVLW